MIDALLTTILFLIGLILTAAAWITVCLLIEVTGWRKDGRTHEGDM